MAESTKTPKKPSLGRKKHFMVDGNRLTLLIAGSERLAALIGLIDGAKHSLRLLYYIYTDDDTGRMVRAAMERALGSEQNQIEPVGNLVDAIFDGNARHSERSA